MASLLRTHIYLFKKNVKQKHYGKSDTHSHVIGKNKVKNTMAMLTRVRV